MKKSIYLIYFLMMIASNVFTQDINNLYHGLQIKKGIITLDNGQKLKFRDLTVQGANIIYSTTKGIKCNGDLSNIYSISKMKKPIAKVTSLCGLTGLLIGFISGMERWEFSDGVRDVLVGTGIGIGTGLLIGNMFPGKEIILYMNKANYQPSVGFIQTISVFDSKLAPTLSLKINLN